MNALVIIAHGSRRKASNDEVIALTEKVRTLSADKFNEVRYAFLELAAPGLPEVVNELVLANANQITVMPYFLNSGSHVTKDIPALLAAAEAAHPRCTFRLAAAIGMYEGMPELILQSADRA